MDDQSQITYIGKVDHRNKMTKFGIKPKDRTKHMYIIGKTGTGKTTFLENMIIQDIQNGHGVAFIDPHGESTEKLLNYIPPWRVNDVIYFNPSDMEFPIAFNPLEDPGPEKRHLVTDGLMSVFKKIWPDAFSGRMEYILNMTMMALMEYPDSTVLSINRMLTDKDFRKKVVASVTDSAVRNAWDELMKWDDKRWSEAIGALVNKVGQFSTNPVIRNIIGQPHSTFSFRKAMDERKIILINLSKGMIGEQNAPLLGALLITKIYLSAMSRAELSASVMLKTPPFYFYVDEFQNFANESFASILSEARKYKLCLTVANQFIAQMEETIRDAVFGNMGTTVAFRVGPLDAEFMEKIFAPVFTQEDLQNILFGQYYLTLQIDNMGSKPFSAQGLGPIPAPEVSMRDAVIEASRKNFAASREEVDQTVKEFFGFEKPKTIHTETVSNSPRPTETRYDAPVSARSYDASRPTTPKPIPSISGYKNESQGVQRIDSKRDVTTPQQQQKNSDSLNDLLSKLDDAVVVPSPAPKPVQVITPKPQPIAKPLAPIAAPIQKPVQAIPQKLDRAASSDKKSALAEALAKAMSQNKVEPVSPPVNPEPIQWVLPDPEPTIIPQQPEEVPMIQEPEPAPIPQIPKRSPVTSSNTVREVPEDILRKVLEE
ncbi:MAG: type IV secretion system DNA-binding domain-containing protein [bacterium]